MSPLLAPGEGVLVDRFAYRRALPRRGDVVLTRAVGYGGGLFIKLVAGLPRERVELSHDRLWIDGRPLHFPHPVVGAFPSSWKLGDDQLFVLSYAATVGTDSRHFGPTFVGDLRGRVWCVYAPARACRMISRVSMPVGSDPVTEPEPRDTSPT